MLEDKKAGLQVAQTHLGFVVFLRETSSKQLYLVCLQKSINTGTSISPTLSTLLLITVQRVIINFIVILLPLVSAVPAEQQADNEWTATN